MAIIRWVTKVLDTLSFFSISWGMEVGEIPET
jgi:hypothetical protein